MNRHVISLVMLLASACCHAAGLSSMYHYQITSPNGNYVVTLDMHENRLNYAVTFCGTDIIEQSPVGIELDNRLFESALGIPNDTLSRWSDGLLPLSADSVAQDTIWHPLYGEDAAVRDHYRELTLHLSKGANGKRAAADDFDKRQYYNVDLIVRAYDEGVALRFHFPEQTNNLFMHLVGEYTSFRMPAGTMAWYEEWAQGPYEKRPLDGQWKECERPLLLQLPSGTYVALLEAAMKDYARGKFALKQPNELQVSLYGSVDIIPPYYTPWRVIMAGRDAIDLINHKSIILNLNADPSHAPNVRGLDWSFVRPGKAFRCCRLDKASILRSIDFCQAFGIPYVELDAGWYGPEGRMESDARAVADTRDFTMEEVCAYARSKGIGVWLYVNQRALYRQLDDLLPLYHTWGISGIKFGFVQVGNQQWSTWLHDAVAKCAAHGLMVDIHDEYRPTGLSRTYPNLLTQEGIRGNEEMPDATHNVTLPFTRFLCGPADYTLCYFDRRVKSTHAHQLAMAAVYYSPLQFLFWYDQPFPDGWEGDELHFWRDIPTVFDESIALAGIPGEYIVQARRSDKDWFVGVMTNEEARTVTINTNFLPKGKYTVEIYNDDPSLMTRTKVSTTIMKVKAGKAISLQLQPSGGAALHFTCSK